MRLQVEIVLFCLLGLVFIEQIRCDRLSDTSETRKWTCSCLVDKENENFTVQENCSSSCNCSSAWKPLRRMPYSLTMLKLTKTGCCLADVSDGANAKRWSCTCAADGLPKVKAVNNENSCFTSCTCSSGTPIEVQFSRKKISREVLVIILLICITITALALVALVLCYIYRRDKCAVQRALFSLDKESSYSSAANLISRGTSSVADYQGYTVTSISPGVGCIPKALSLLGSKSSVIHGTISRFSYSELESATGSFSESNLIGIGGSSHVYRGDLKDGRTVAIKRIKTKGGPDAESLFLTEIKLISRLHHCHVVPLLGYCSEHRGKHIKRLLIFEYMPSGNLRDCLDGVSGICLDWGTRIAIALGAAKGLEYLHEAAAPRILHRDVKSTNVLLDENLKPKITDLGMAKHLLNEGIPSCSSSPARMQGTFGYFAPEYAIVGRASLKSDVFSFGVVLLELISGRQPIYKSSNKAEESLVIWAMPILQDSKRVISELPDPRLKGTFQEEEMQVMAYLAKECLLLDPDSRPTMSEVVQILSTIAPEKSRRKNLPLNLFQNSSNDGAENKSSEIHDEQDADPIEIKKISKITSKKQATPCPLCSEVDPCLCFEKDQKETDTISAARAQKILSNSDDAICWNSQDDEVVDLTEPRFESFCGKF